MVTFIYTYDILPGKMDEFRKWVQSTGLPFWKGQAEVRSIRVLENLFAGVGSPQRTVILEFESVGDLERIFEREEAKRVAAEFLDFAANVKTHYCKTLHAA
ncbi:MAG: hypothetical protein ACE5IM_10995 [Nitrospinota bacterium]